jgi:alpha-beta hydrolase superfamily lysophospholipase
MRHGVLALIWFFGAYAGVDALDYDAPVDGPVVDPFRPPLHAWAPGNRGVDYLVDPGTPVAAAAPGEVAFAGQVGGDLHVVVLHDDGLRTSYSFLASITVRRGERVARGDPVGTAAGAVHFGVRDGDRYLDPLAVLDGRMRVQLLPDRPVEPEPVTAERSRLVELARGVGRLGAALPATPTDALPAAWRGWLHYASELTTPASVRAAAAVADWHAQRQSCTDATHPSPPSPGGRRVVLVAGLGSTSEAAAVHGVDTAALGYQPNDVLVFSYRGGTTADHRYAATDTKADLRLSSARLHDLVAALVRRDLGTPVDVIAHSQGGLVARQALLDGAPAALVATLGSPHQGADLATAAAMLRAAGLAVGSTSVLQMAETSTFMADLAARPLPSATRVVSVAARGDLVVPAPRSRLAGAANMVVTLPPPFASVHARLPGAPEATRELALALAGLPPTCRSLPDVVADHLVGTATSLATDSLGATLALAANLRQ